MNRRLEGFEAGCDGAELIAALADTGSVLEFGKGHTQAVTALGKMAGRTVAFVYTGKGDTCDNRMKKIARFGPLCGLLQHPGGVPGGFHGSQAV